MSDEDDVEERFAKKIEDINETVHEKLDEYIIYIYFSGFGLSLFFTFISSLAPFTIPGTSIRWEIGSFRAFIYSNSFLLVLMIYHFSSRLSFIKKGTYGLKENKDVIIENISQIKKDISEINSWVHNFIMWTDGVPEPLTISVSNMYDFMIHLPFHLARSLGAFEKERLNIKISNEGSDLDAIKAISDGEGITITDPYYLVKDKQIEDGVILSPILIKPAVWVLDNTNVNNQNSEKKIFAYDEDSTSYRLGKYFLLNNNINKDKIKPSYLSEFIQNFNNDNFKNSIKEVYNGDEFDQLENEFKAPLNYYRVFLKIVFLLAQDDNVITPNVKSKIKNFFLQFDYLFLTEPELCFIKNIFSDIDPPISIKQINGDFIFTAVITTKRFLKNNPVAVLRFLKALTLGFLKCRQIPLEDSLSSVIDVTMMKDIPKMVGSIKNNISDSELEPELYFPKDLIIYTKEQKNTYYNILKSTINFHDPGATDDKIENLVISEQDITIQKQFVFIRDRLLFL